MNFEDLQNQVRDALDVHTDFGRSVTEVRIETAKRLLVLLREGAEILREPLFKDSTLAVDDNRTNAIWASHKLVFCLTQHYPTRETRGAMTLPPTVTDEILTKCETTMDEVLLLVEAARQIEREELQKLGATSYVIARAVCT